MNQTTKEKGSANPPVNPIPEGMRTVTPHLICAGAAQAIDFYKKAFGAVELSRMPGPDGNVMHASIRIGDSVIMLNDEMPQWGALGPKSLKGSPSHNPSLRRGRGRALCAGREGGRQGDDAARRYVLGRSLRQGGRSFRPPMVNWHTSSGG